MIITRIFPTSLNSILLLLFHHGEKKEGFRSFVVCLTLLFLKTWLTTHPLFGSQLSI
jgi:hypothetical protein